MIASLAPLALLLAAQANASPINKRQSAIDTATAVIPSVVATTTNTVSAAQPTQQATDTIGYPCPDGYFLTYTEEQYTYDNTPVQVLRQFVGDFQNASYFGWISGQGGNEVGATRTLVSGHQEVLVEQVSDIEDTDILTQTVFNLTNGPIQVGSGMNATMLSTYQTVLQVIRNNTASGNDDDDDSNADNVGTVKIFSNFCAASQPLGRMAQSNAFMGALANLQVLVNGGQLTESNFPEVTATLQTTFTIAAPTNTFLTTVIANAPTNTVVNTETAVAATNTVSETVTPSIVTEVESNTVTPSAVTQTNIATVTPMASTEVVSVTTTPEANTVTDVTTINPLLTTSVSPVTAAATTTV